MMAKPNDADRRGAGERDEALAQEQVQQRQEDRLEQKRRLPGTQEERVRRDQGGHDRPVGNDHRPHPRSEAGSGED
jgi:hypothetical protein